MLPRATPWTHVAILALLLAACARAPSPSPTHPGAVPQNVSAAASRACEAPIQRGPVDVVFVVDVSTSMMSLGLLRSSFATLFDRIEASSLDAQVGLTTFENDVVVHARGSFLDREAFFRELDGQLVPDRWTPDVSLPRHLANFEPEENVLDAISFSAEWFPFRPQARLLFVLVTDDTFLEPPAVFGDGTPARTRFAELSGTLERRGIVLHSIHVGTRGRGLSEPYRGRPGLVEATGGSWIDLETASPQSFDRLLSQVVGLRGCAPDVGN